MMELHMINYELNKLGFVIWINHVGFIVMSAPAPLTSIWTRYFISVKIACKYLFYYSIFENYL
jgi:hypothetical protein